MKGCLPLLTDTKILSPAQITVWRKSIVPTDNRLAVITGSFNILQPGNLLAIQQAKQCANHVCVVLEPDKAHSTNRNFWNTANIRAEMASCLQDVSAVFIVRAVKEDIQQLRPYILIDCLAQSGSSQLRLTAREEAETVIDIPAVTGCFTRDIAEAFRISQTPVQVPIDLCEPIPTSDDIDRVTRSCRNGGYPLVTVNGCFDLLHIGHVRMLSHARSFGHELIVLVNDDASVRAYKGPTRPLFPIHFRLHALNTLAPVSFAYPFPGDNPIDMLSDIKPDIHVKGGTFEKDRVCQEQKLVESWGGHIEFCPMVKGYSTSRILNVSH